MRELPFTSVYPLKIEKIKDRIIKEFLMMDLDEVEILLVEDNETDAELTIRALRRKI